MWAGDSLLFRWIFLVLPNPWPNQPGSITADFTGSSYYTAKRAIFFYSMVPNRESLKKAREWVTKHNSWELYLATAKSQQMDKTYPMSSYCLHRVIRTNVRLKFRENTSDVSLGSPLLGPVLRWLFCLSEPLVVSACVTARDPAHAASSGGLGCVREHHQFLWYNPELSQCGK